MATRRDGVERREALLEAALRCFERDGVMGVGIEEIRREAGASPSSVYHHFGGLQDVMLALLTRTFHRLFGHLTERVVRTRSARGAVQTLVRAQLEWVVANPIEARFMYQAMALELAPNRTEALQARKAEALEPLVRHLTQFIEDGSLPAWSPLVFDVVLLGPTHEACRRWLAGAQLDPEWMQLELPRLAWRSIERR